MDLEKIREAHAAEIREAGKTPNAHISGERIRDAQRLYFKMQDDAREMLRQKKEAEAAGACDEQMDYVDIALIAAGEKLVGATEILKVLGFDCIDEREKAG